MLAMRERVNKVNIAENYVVLCEELNWKASIMWNKNEPNFSWEHGTIISAKGYYTSIAQKT